MYHCIIFSVQSVPRVDRLERTMACYIYSLMPSICALYSSRSHLSEPISELYTWIRNVEIHWSQELITLTLHLAELADLVMSYNHIEAFQIIWQSCPVCIQTCQMHQFADMLCQKLTKPRFIFVWNKKNKVNTKYSWPHLLLYYAC